MNSVFKTHHYEFERILNYEKDATLKFETVRSKFEIDFLLHYSKSDVACIYTKSLEFQNSS